MLRLLSDVVEEQRKNIAKLLKVKPRDIGFDFQNCYPCTGDKLVKVLSFDGRPNKFLWTKPRKGRGRMYLGLSLYQNKLDPNLQYVILHIDDREAGVLYSVDVLAIVAGKAFRFARNYHRQSQGGLDVVKPVLADKLLEEIIASTIGVVEHKKELKKAKVSLTCGILFDGPPGNGKSMMCRYIRQWSQRHGLSVNIVDSSELDHAYRDGNLKDLFNKDDVIFLDDIDISYLDRVRGDSKMACAMLGALDGLEKSTGVSLRIFTTNEKVEDMDPAFIRPGRIDKRFTFEKPDEGTRRRLIKTLWEPTLVEQVGIEHIISETDTLSFAEIMAIRTQMLAAKIIDGTDADFDLTLDKIMGTATNTAAAPLPRKAKEGGDMGFATK